jgi:hypothetical protein
MGHLLDSRAQSIDFPILHAYLSDSKSKHKIPISDLGVGGLIIPSQAAPELSKKRMKHIRMIGMGENSRKKHLLLVRKSRLDKKYLNVLACRVDHSSQPEKKSNLKRKAQFNTMKGKKT